MDLATRILAADPRPRIIGVSGGQGSGKSTLAGALAVALGGSGLRPCTVSLDDFYLTRAERERLAARVHPLFATRGVPGTHDIARLESVLDGLFSPGPIALPLFDKATDDRVTAPRLVHPPFDIVIIEGWCIGARPQASIDLVEPVNSLERDEDSEGIWRGYVNDALAGAYRRLNGRIDWLVFLAVGDIAAVLAFRAEQERAIPAARRMDAARLARFVAHYERLTRSMLLDVPARADAVVRLAADRSYSVQGRSATVPP